MNVEALNRKVQAELARLVEQGVLAPEQSARIEVRYPVGRWDLISLVRWFSVLGVVAIAVGVVLAARNLAEMQTLVEAVSLLAAIGLGVVGVWLERRRQMVRTGSALLLLAAMALQVFTFAIAIRYSSGSGNWPAVVGLDCLLFLVMAYALKNRLILVYAVINVFVWFGGQTGYVSGWGMYWLRMTYPVRFLAAGVVSLGIAYAHLRLVPLAYQSFSRVYTHFGMLVTNLSLWFLSLFGYFEEHITWSGTEWQRVGFSGLWAVVSVASIFAAIPTGLRLLRGYGLTFLIINVYTFYFQFVVANSAGAWFLHLLLVGGTMVGCGVWFERNRRGSALETKDAS